MFTGYINDIESIARPLNYTLCAGNCSLDDTEKFRLPGSVDSNEWTGDAEIPTGRSHDSHMYCSYDDHMLVM